jgi:RNA polymerase sigma-32 factor
MAEDSGFTRYVALLRAPRLDAETERQLAERWIATRDPVAARTLVEAHLRFVVKMAKGLSGYGLPIADLVAEGNIGLLEALERFDPGRGVRFLSYAAWWVRALMLAYVQRHWSIVRVPMSAHRAKLFFRLTRARARIATALGHTLSADKIDAMLARELDAPARHVREMMTAITRRDLSLDEPQPGDSDIPRLAALVDDGAGQEEAASSHERGQIVRRRLAALEPSLTARERYILRHRLMSDEPHPLLAIGQRLGVSRERVRQLETSLKRKLRDAFAELAPERRAA